MRKKIVVTGANGQLGNCLRDLSENCANDFEFLFTDVDELDITDASSVLAKVREFGADFIVNAAAYTAVDRAESEVETATLINTDAVANLAAAAKETGAMLVHISTDYVFNGQSTIPYTPEMPADPVSVYGRTKWEGEQRILESGCRAVIIRTAWLYSQYGHNFVKTMLWLAESGKPVRVVSDQIGAPTFAGDLAAFILRVLACEQQVQGVETYHFANDGRISWFDFAVEIYRLSNAYGIAPVSVAPIATADYPTPARRPAFSLFDLSKSIRDFDFPIPVWSESLANVFPAIYENYKKYGK